MVQRTPVNSIISALYKMIERTDKVELLKSTSIPIQLMLGTKDKMYDHHTIIQNCADVAIIDIHLFPTGHLGIKEMPEEYLRAFESFVRFTESYSTDLSSG